MSRLATLHRQLGDAMKQHLVAGKAPRLPEAGRLFWQWFGELNSARTWHQAGPNPISHAEIEAWARLNRWPVQSRHVAAIRALDDAWLENFYSKRSKPPSEQKTLPPRSQHAVSPKLFDAIFG
ncbi:hypothetical protein CDO26_13300 [Sinorhizobium meliloti]|uniref:phage tail assembly chaperone n=1 Tax=Rhizobium meliloti TaxID=382 RepID=UPI000B4A48C5|nr:hypothetical protein [Sinorhizobium meliloti]ASP85482.1 hypothetical protein CDO26_13300 [Sinorhizobium meliloti]MQW26672.1 hypothetical protein [Sinorhizobium meliloti]